MVTIFVVINFFPFTIIRAIVAILHILLIATQPI